MQDFGCNLETAKQRRPLLKVTYLNVPKFVHLIASEAFLFKGVLPWYDGSMSSLSPLLLPRLCAGDEGWMQASKVKKKQTSPLRVHEWAPLEPTPSMQPWDVVATQL